MAGSLDNVLIRYFYSWRPYKSIVRLCLPIIVGNNVACDPNRFCDPTQSYVPFLFEIFLLSLFALFFVGTKDIVEVLLEIV